MVLDSLRTIVIWVFGLVATDSHTGEKEHWETFDPSGPGWLQIGGFILLLAGSALYNEREIPNSVQMRNEKPLPLLSRDDYLKYHVSTMQSTSLLLFGLGPQLSWWLVGQLACSTV